MGARVAVVGEYDDSVAAHKETIPALKFSAAFISAELEVAWVPTTEVDTELFDRFDGVWMAAGPAYRCFDTSIAVIRQARENSFPCLATCRGFQHMVLEFARNVAGLRNAGHQDYCPRADPLAISLSSAPRRARKRYVEIVKGSRLEPMYFGRGAIERFFGIYGVNPEIESTLTRYGFESMASDSFGNYRVGGLPRHPFFLGSLFVPQLRATRDSPHPLITAFLKTCVIKRQFGLPKSR